MLTLGRRRGERVTIDVAGVRVVVEVIEVVGERVRLGFTAPPEAVIHRAELAADEGREGEVNR